MAIVSTMVECRASTWAVRGSAIEKTSLPACRILFGVMAQNKLARSGIFAIMYIVGNWFCRRATMNANVVDVRNTFSEYLNRASYQGQRIIIERRGKPVAALVPLEDLERIEALENEADVKAAKKARKEKGGVTLDKYCKKHGL
jgi:prevent-host-death family protein